jgi:glycosyltransferase involved in cell wall biosynthesis
MRVLLSIDQPLLPAGGHIAGLQVRAYEMAHALAAAGHDVTVAQSGPGCERGPDAIRIIPLEHLADEPRFDAVIVTPTVWERQRSQLRASRLIIDGYEPPFGSFLSHATAQRPQRPAMVDAWYRGTIIDYLRALGAADAVICANPRQQLSYETLLCAIGAIGPGRLRSGDVLLVHSGVPPEPVPALTAASLRAVHARGPVVLWAGGVYAWYDLETYLRAIPDIAGHVPTAQFLFAGLQGVGAESARWSSDRVRVFEGLTALSDRLHFEDWLPYGDRGQLYRCAQVAVSAHQPGLETTLSMRTRLVDSVWARTPTVATAGDWLADTLATQDAAVVVPPAAPSLLAAAVVTMLTDSGVRHRIETGVDSVANSWLRWSAQIGPLDTYLRRPAGIPVDRRDHSSVQIRSRRRNQIDMLQARFQSWAARSMRARA